MPTDELDAQLVEAGAQLQVPKHREEAVEWAQERNVARGQLCADGGAGEKPEFACGGMHRHSAAETSLLRWGHLGVMVRLLGDLLADSFRVGVAA